MEIKEVFILKNYHLYLRSNADCHDRLIVLDYGLTTEQAYHCGASSKDAGKKLYSIDVANPDDTLLVPVFVLAMDAEKCSRND